MGVAVPSEDVTGTVAGPLKVLVIDQTKDADKFEHDLANEVYHKLKTNGVELSRPAVVFVSEETELDIELSTDDYSAVLLFAHGSEGSRDGDAAVICFGKEPIPWEQYQIYIDALKDKMLVLCVCEGINIDSVAATINGLAPVRIVVGSKQPVSEKVARTFYPEFFQLLKVPATHYFQTDDVQNCVDSANRATDVDIMEARW